MRNLSLVVLAVFLFALAGSFADVEITVADIPFSFIAEGKTYPAGTYRFSENTVESAVTIQGEKPAKSSGMVLITTRLAARSTSANDVDIRIRCGWERSLSFRNPHAQRGWILL